MSHDDPGMMPVFRVLLPHPLLSLTLLLLWLLLNNSVSAGDLVLGSVLGVFIPLYTKRFWPETATMRRPRVAIRLAAVVLWDILVANVRVSRLVLGPRGAIRPQFVRVPLDLDGDFGISVLASVISLTPGTVSAGLDQERRYLLVHALSEQDPAELVRAIKSRYEAPIKEIFAC
jgi:multicomponent K+:H+ antiporter subunit E